MYAYVGGVDASKNLAGNIGQAAIAAVQAELGFISYFTKLFLNG